MHFSNQRAIKLCSIHFKQDLDSFRLWISMLTFYKHRKIENWSLESRYMTKRYDLDGVCYSLGKKLSNMIQRMQKKKKQYLKKIQVFLVSGCRLNQQMDSSEITWFTYQLMAGEL